VTHISKHDTEQEGEGNYTKDWRVYFFVVGYTVGIDNFLEYPSELIHSEETRRLNSMALHHF
jgi:hypothetical protein